MQVPREIRPTKGLHALLRGLENHWFTDSAQHSRAKEGAMRAFILAILGSGIVFLLASGTRNRGWFVSDQLCLLGGALCDNPGLILFVGIVLLVVAAVNAVVQS